MHEQERTVPEPEDQGVFPMHQLELLTEGESLFDEAFPGMLFRIAGRILERSLSQLLHLEFAEQIAEQLFRVAVGLRFTGSLESPEIELLAAELSRETISSHLFSPHVPLSGEQSNILLIVGFCQVFLLLINIKNEKDDQTIVSSSFLLSSLS